MKVLDFGLAKALDSAASDAEVAQSPTISIRATQQGVVLGTAAYMAPEQARGRRVDHRADVWAFGCVLFEMLAGRRAFDAADVTDTIVAVLSKEPDWQMLPASAAAVRPLLSRCLRKDVKQRLQAIGDARIQIEELIAGPGPAGRSPRTCSCAPRGRSLPPRLREPSLLGGLSRQSSEEPPRSGLHRAPRDPSAAVAGVGGAPR